MKTAPAYFHGHKKKGESFSIRANHTPTIILRQAHVGKKLRESSSKKESERKRKQKEENKTQHRRTIWFSRIQHARKIDQNRAKFGCHGCHCF